MLLALVFSCADQGQTNLAGEATGDSTEPLYKRVVTPPAPVLTAESELATFTIAPGYAIDLVASEPLVEDPVAADWDEDGNLYIAEMRAFMEDLEGTGEERPIGAVVRLSDSDGDGRFDTREELITNLVLPRALRIVNEGLLIGEMGKLWLCPSSSGWSRDIDCGSKRFLGAYGAHQGSVEHAENGLLMGLDNWMYSAKSARRLRVLDGKLVEEPTLFRGQWGITQDDQGRLYYNTNSNLLLGDYYDAQQIISSGNHKAAGLNQRISANDEVYSVRVNTGVNRAYVPGTLRSDGRLRNATSASGMVVYQGGRFDRKAPHVPHVFVTEPAANLVAAFKFKEDGLKVVAEQMLYPDEEWGQRDFMVSTDERFRPVDVFSGPDGMIYVLDFYRGVIQDHVFISEELKAQARERRLIRPLGMGRIWRISEQGRRDRQSRPEWAFLDTAGLAALLAAPDIWRRNTAQRLLLRRTAEDTQSVLAHVVKEGEATAAARAIWILRDRNELSDAILSFALRRSSAIAEAALLAGAARIPISDLLELVAANVSPRGLLYSIAALRHHNGQERVLRVLADLLLENEGDPYIRDTLLSALRGEELRFAQTLVDSGKWSAEQETESRFLTRLSQQMFRAEGAEAVGLLDYITQVSPEAQWAQEALLLGFFERTRENDFSRTELEHPHPVFALGEEALWHATSRARRGFTWPGDDLAADAKPLTPAQKVNRDAGERFYANSCANCHGGDGGGIGALGPPLANSHWVTSAPERLARIVLHGVQGPIEVLGQEWNSAMPGHKDFPGLDDAVASGLLTYLRRAWGHSGRAIDPDFMNRVRTETASRSALWTVPELVDLQINTHYQIYVGSYGRPSQPMGFSYDGANLVVKSGIFNGPLIETKEDHFLFEPRGLKFEFVVDVAGSVPAVLLSTGSGQVRMPRVDP